MIFSMFPAFVKNKATTKIRDITKVTYLKNPISVYKYNILRSEKNKILSTTENTEVYDEYGNKIYTVNYEITNFVSNLQDAQMVYWTLIPYDFSTAIQNVEIEIYSDFKYEDTLDVWGYGNYGGLCYVSDGTIKMSSDGVLNTSEYMTILVKFPQNTFKATNNIKESSHYYDYVSLLLISISVGIIMSGKTLEKNLLVV